MASSTVRAQELANEANLQMNEANNQTQRDLAAQANEFNKAMLEYQNTWNLERRNEEWAYNDPAAQMERLIKAGINPNFALGNVSPGNAQQLTSGDPKAAEVARTEAGHVEPEYDPMLAQHIGNVVAVARDAVNAALGFGELDLKGRDVSTRERAQISQDSLNKAAAAEKRAQTEGQNIQNKWNLSTFSVRAQQESQKLYNMWAQYKKMDADTQAAKAYKLNLDASTDLVRENIRKIGEDLKLRKEELAVAWKNAATSERLAGVSENSLKLEDERFSAEVQKMNNDTLMQFMYKFGQQIKGGMSAKVGIEGLGISGSASSQQVYPAAQAKMFDCGIELIQRASEHPEDKELMRMAGEAVEMINNSTRPVANPPMPEGAFSLPDASIPQFDLDTGRVEL